MVTEPLDFSLAFAFKVSIAFTSGWLEGRAVAIFKVTFWSAFLSPPPQPATVNAIAAANAATANFLVHFIINTSFPLKP